MKKLMIALALVGFTTTAMAQEFVPTKKYSVATNSFWANWFVSAGGHYTATYSSQEKGVPFAPFHRNRGQIGFNVAIGKWFTPGIGLRTRFEGIWNTRVNNVDDHRTYKGWYAHEDVLFNLSNILCGYNEKRFWNFIPYAGIGMVRNMSQKNNDISYHAGLLNNFRISNAVNLFIEIYANAAEGSIDASPNRNDYTKPAVEDPWRKYKKTSLRYWDKQLGIAAGLTFNLGKNTWEKTPDVDALMAMNKEQLDALRASLKAQEDENARLRELLANQPEKIREGQTKYVEVMKYASAKTSIFFALNSDKIAKKEEVNLNALVDFAKENSDAKIQINGYADSATGNATINNSLSERRANAVKNYLIGKGVAAERIIVAQGHGGVADLEPAPLNRRAIVEIK